MRVWERENYKVVEKVFDYSLYQFDVVRNDGELVATITPSSLEDQDGIVAALNRGEDVDGWEDGSGNTIYID